MRKCKSLAQKEKIDSRTKQEQARTFCSLRIIVRILGPVHLATALFHKGMEFNLVPIGTDSGIRYLCCRYYIVRFLEYICTYIHTYRKLHGHRESVSSINTKEIVSDHLYHCDLYI